MKFFFFFVVKMKTFYIFLLGNIFLRLLFVCSKKEIQTEDQQDNFSIEICRELPVPSVPEVLLKIIL